MIYEDCFDAMMQDDDVECESDCKKCPDELFEECNFAKKYGDYLRGKK